MGDDNYKYIFQKYSLNNRPNEWAEGNTNLIHDLANAIKRLDTMYKSEEQIERSRPRPQPQTEQEREMCCKWLDDILDRM